MPLDLGSLDGDFIGLGTVVNVVTVVLGSTCGLLLGDRLSERTRATVTDALGLFTAVIGALSLRPLLGTTLAQATGGQAMIVVLLGLLGGAMVGSALRIEDRLESLGDWARARLGDRAGARFTEGFVTATLLFCVGPMAILGSIQDGLGQGSDQLVAKSIMDGFASIGFASSLGIGVLASVLPLALYQGGLTALGAVLGDVLPAAQVDALGATGGVVLLGLALRLLGLKAVRVADLLPALVATPLLVALWQAVR